jgi:nucleoside-diphosphate-sugar epimerase
VRAVAARFAPSVHGEGHHHGFVAIIAEAARRRGAAIYPGDGANRWPAVHRSDAARLVRLGLEKAPAGTVLHAAAEEGVPVRHIVEALAERLDVPARSAPTDQIAEELPFVGRFLAADIPPPARSRATCSDGNPPARRCSTTSSPATTTADGPPAGRAGRGERLGMTPSARH